VNEIASPSRQNAFETPPSSRRGTPQRCKWCQRVIRDKRPDALYCTPAHRLAAWRAENDPENAPARPNKRERKGTGITIYVNKHEMAELAEGRVPATVVAKAAAKLKPPAPLPGQTDLIEALAEVEAERIAT
jgi:hypothetical protein